MKIQPVKEPRWVKKWNKQKVTILMPMEALYEEDNLFFLYIYIHPYIYILCVLFYYHNLIRAKWLQYLCAIKIKYVF